VWNFNEISQNEAEKLLETGEWCSDLQIDELLKDAVISLPTVCQKIGEEEWRDPNRSDELRKSFGVFQNLVAEIYEVKYVRPPPTTLNWQVRIAPHRVFKIRNFSNDLVTKGLKWIAAIGTLARFDVCELAGATGASLDVMRSVYQNYTKLTDPLQCAEFEKTYEMCALTYIKDYDALNRGDYYNAYGRRYPSRSDLREALLQSPAESVDDAISQLFATGVLREREDGRIAIAF
jgi:hypothetical protein